MSIQSQATTKWLGPIAALGELEPIWVLSIVSDPRGVPYWSYRWEAILPGGTLPSLQTTTDRPCPFMPIDAPLWLPAVVVLTWNSGGMACASTLAGASRTNMNGRKMREEKLRYIVSPPAGYCIPGLN
jgi:hypothetical protein